MMPFATMWDTNKLLSTHGMRCTGGVVGSERFRKTSLRPCRATTLVHRSVAGSEIFMYVDRGLKGAIGFSHAWWTYASFPTEEPFLSLTSEEGDSASLAPHVIPDVLSFSFAPTFPFFPRVVSSDPEGGHRRQGSG